MNPNVVECLTCTEHHGFDVVFTMPCFLNGHQRMMVEFFGEEE